MTPRLPVKRLFKIAAISSIVLMGALSLAPYVINSKHIELGKQFFTMFFTMTLCMFVIWCVNIGVVHLTWRRSTAKIAAYKRYLLSYLVCIALVFLATDIINSFVHDPAMRQKHLYAVYIFVIFLNTIILIMQELVLLRQTKTTIELENAELRLNNAEATNQLLKQQIHPHFLFNSLSTLKTLIGKDAGKAEDYLLKLSDFLRASLSSAVPNMVTLAEELAHCLNYLEMQQMRFGKALQYNVQLPQDVQERFSVPVFSLVLLVENAVKHNKLTQEQPLQITIEYREERIITTNNMQEKDLQEKSTGLGLENLAERYHILSGDEIIIVNTGELFSVSIKAIPHEDSSDRR